MMRTPTLTMLGPVMTMKKKAWSSTSKWTLTQQHSSLSVYRYPVDFQSWVLSSVVTAAKSVPFSEDELEQLFDVLTRKARNTTKVNQSTTGLLESSYPRKSWR